LTRLVARYFLSASRATLHWRQWRDEVVAFDEMQGQTHLMSAGAAAVLMELVRAERGCTFDEIAKQLFLRTDCDPGDDAALSKDERAALEGILSELARLGLARTLAS